MMDQFVTFGDLLKIGSILLELASLVFYIYYCLLYTSDAADDRAIV